MRQRSTSPSRSTRWRDFPRDRRDLGLLLVLAALAIILRATSIATSGGLLGFLGYDDGVYFGAATAFTHGVLPYRDYLLLHPPGIVLVLAPFALAGHLVGDPAAFALARVAVVVLGGINTVVAARVAGRFGRSAGLATGVLYALWPVLIHTERNTDFHGIQSTLVLLALLVLSRPGRIRPGRAAVAGCLLGLATAVQLWQGVFVLLAIGWVLLRAPAGSGSRARSAAACAGGAAAAFAVVCVPFLIAAPEPMLRYVVLDQVGRPRQAVGLVERVLALEGLPALLTRPSIRVPMLAAAGAAGLVLLVATAWRRPWTRVWAVMAVIGGIVALIAPSFHADYAGLMAPPAVLILGTGVGDIFDTVRRRLPGSGVAAPVVVAVLALLVAGSMLPRNPRPPLDLEGLMRDTEPARCVSADVPTLLILTDTLSRNLERGCAIVLDVSGIVYDSDREAIHAGRARRDLAQYQRAMAAWYTSGEVVLFAGDVGGLAEDTVATIRRALPYEHRRGAIRVWSAVP